MHCQAASLSCLPGVMNTFQDLLGSDMVTGFHDVGMNFSFAAPVAWVMHGLGAEAGGWWGKVCVCGFLHFT